MLKQIRTTLKRLNIGIIICTQIFFFPAATYAQEVPSSDVPPAETTQSAEETTETPQSITDVAAPPPEEQPQQVQQQAADTENTQGPTQPPGPARSSYVRNPDTGMWENDYYIWDPATGQTQPKNDPSYSYNPATGRWDTTEWYYSPEAGKYMPNVISVASNPALVGAAPSALASASSGPNAQINGTGPGSSNAINLGGNMTGTFDLFFDASISNKIGQLSRSGNAAVLGNTNGGSALTGDASSIANILNMLQSSWGPLGSDEIATFVANVDGDVYGDLLIDPSGAGNSYGNRNIDVNVANDGRIYNDINVAAASGDAAVSGNTNGGNATTGDANAVVNLINMINSAIRANHSFLGVLNINGNLNGDILLPAGMLQAIIAATGPDSNNQIAATNDSTLDVTVDDNKAIINDVVTSAESGNALVQRNTNAGNASTGDADTNVVLLNLTGRRVVASNAMVVFVNVLGSWVGLIMDAPAGSYAALATGPNSTNSINANRSLDANVDITNNSLIENDVSVSAASGDATVAGNTNAGDATTGDASASVNVLNMIDSEFDISDWFGVLFINVFGSWIGSFGINTAAGNQPPTTATTAAPSGQASQAVSPTSSDTFRFVPRTSVNSVSLTGDDNDNNTQAVASAQTSGPAPTTPGQTATNGASTGSGRNDNSTIIWLSGATIMIGILMLGGERFMALLRQRQLT